MNKTHSYTVHKHIDNTILEMFKKVKEAVVCDLNYKRVSETWVLYQGSVVCITQ